MVANWTSTKGPYSGHDSVVVVLLLVDFASIVSVCGGWAWSLFLCPQRNFGRHIVIALSVRPSVSPSVPPAFVSGPYHLYSLR